MHDFNVVLADFPWKYANRPEGNKTKFGRGAHGQYDYMTEKELCDMGLYMNSIMADNCAVFLWVTGPRMDSVFRVVESWNSLVRYKKDQLRYTTKAFSWVKVAQKVKLPCDCVVKRGRDYLILPAGTHSSF